MDITIATTAVLDSFNAMAPAVELIPEAQRTVEHWSPSILAHLASGETLQATDDMNGLLDDLSMLLAEHEEDMAESAADEAEQALQAARGRV